MGLKFLVMVLYPQNSGDFTFLGLEISRLYSSSLRLYFGEIIRFQDGDVVADVFYDDS